MVGISNTRTRRGLCKFIFRIHLGVGLLKKCILLTLSLLTINTPLALGKLTLTDIRPVQRHAVYLYTGQCFFIPAQIFTSS